MKGHSRVFKRSALKDVGFKDRGRGLVVQALKALGREHVDQKVIARIRQQLASKACGRILGDARSVTGWIHAAIQRVGREVDGRTALPGFLPGNVTSCVRIRRCRTPRPDQRRRLTASATTHRISNIMVAPTRAVLPDGSNGGATSTTSPPTRLSPDSPRIMICASRVE